MSFELRLTFFGLTALVPNKKAGTPDDPPEWFVVMPALPNGETLKFEERQLPAAPFRVDEIPIAPHQAALVVNARAIREGTTKEARLQFRNPTTVKEDAESDLLFQLNREAVEIEGPAGDDDGVKAISAPLGVKVPDVHNPAELHNLKWLPQIKDCLPDHPGGVPFDRNLFDPEALLPIDSQLAAVVRLDRGTLETTHVYRTPKDEPVPYEFRNLSGDLLFEQALAESFRLRVTVEAVTDTATLVLTDQDGVKRRLVVGPHFEENGKPVAEVKVYNRELEEILGFGSTFMQQKSSVPDLDFLIFYKLSPAWSTLKATDLVAPQLGGKGGGGRSKPCEPPAFPGLS